ncbi:MAG: hypothetical protein IAX21_00680 [Candidatus Bathyarchaeota archaeon]|nr:MAG: hypothetical protein NUK63_05165 [Candidatus Bathyarchaeum tardum]WNZ29419.1 MAG: hypothetical protein IAX21_00680 [Candidatus Bathyarchaeota archaeon]
MAKKRKKDNEISVRAPDYLPKKTPIFKDTTGTEALDVFKVVKMIGRILSLAMFAVGIFIVCLSAYSIIMSISMFLNPMFMIVLGITGALNIFCGLLLLAKK